MKYSGLFTLLFVMVGCGEELEIKPGEGSWSTVSFRVEDGFSSEALVCDVGNPAAPPEALVVSDLGNDSFTLSVTLVGQVYEMDCDARNDDGLQSDGQRLGPARTAFSCTFDDEEALRASQPSSAYPSSTWAGGFESSTTAHITSYVEMSEDQRCVYVQELKLDS